MEKWWKMGKAWEHLSRDVDVRWTKGGQCSTTNLCAINHKANFLTMKLTVDLVNVWGLGYCWSTRWWSLVCHTWKCRSLPPFTSAMWQVFPDLPRFLPLFHFRALCWTQTREQRTENNVMILSSLVPRLLHSGTWNWTCACGESLVFFLTWAPPKIERR